MMSLFRDAWRLSLAGSNPGGHTAIGVADSVVPRPGRAETAKGSRVLGVLGQSRNQAAAECFGNDAQVTSVLRRAPPRPDKRVACVPRNDVHVEMGDVLPPALRFAWKERDAIRLKPAA